MATYFVAPFQPVRDPATWEELMHLSNLTIDVDSYKGQLVAQWPQTKIHPNVGGEILLWTLFEAEANSIACRGIGTIQSNRQIVTFDSPYVDFFLWHRTMIPQEHRLWLFKDTSWNNLEMRSDTLWEEIAQFFKTR